MVSPGELRLVAELTEDGTEFEPEITDSGAVDYPTAARLLEDRDDDAEAVLDRFDSRGILAGEFVSKVYVCPECSAEGMQYTTVCPSCEAANAVETTVLEHTCGHIAPESEFEGDGGYRCPDCEMSLQPEDVDGEERYHCRECAEIFERPDERLWCRDCLYMFPPEETIERVLYRYGLTEEGEQWLDRHRTARRAIAETLSERSFETEVDTTVTDEEGKSHGVHVLAEDELLGERRVVDIYETPDVESVDAFQSLARSVGAHPIVLTTTGTVEEGVAERAEGPDLTVLTARRDGTLESEYEIGESTAHRRSVFQRISAAVDVPAWKEQ